MILFSACTTSQQAKSTNKATETLQDHCKPTGKILQNIASLPGAQGDWPMFRGDLMHQGSAALGGSKLALAWTYCTQKSVFSSPVVQGGIVYVASTDTTVTAINIQSPKVLWHFRADSPFYGTPVINNETLYIDSLDGTMYALNIHSGQVKWETKVQTAGAKLWSSPIVADGLVIFGTASTFSENPKLPGQVIALDASTGQQRWRSFTLANGAQGGGVWSSPTVDSTQHIVYVGTGDPDDGVQAYNLSDGRLLWHWRSVVHDVSDTDVGAGPLLFPGKQSRLQVMVGGKNGSVYSLDASTGSVTWHMQMAPFMLLLPKTVVRPAGSLTLLQVRYTGKHLFPNGHTHRQLSQGKQSTFRLAMDSGQVPEESIC
jgi:outer membrane protein assembly factor BamB